MNRKYILLIILLIIATTSSALIYWSEDKKEERRKDAVFERYLDQFRIKCPECNINMPDNGPAMMTHARSCWESYKIDD